MPANVTNSGPTRPPLTKSEYAYEELRRRILDDELPPGTRLLLRSLADELGLSVMPIRDALRMLEHDGLVTSESHRGAIVTPISADIIVETISIRMWLEVLAIREATPLHTDDTIAVAERAMKAANKALSVKDGLQYAAANRELHECLEAPAPAAVRQLITETWDRLWQERRRMSLFRLVPARRQLAQREHAEILKAVSARDPDAAAEAMLRHRESTIAAWREALKGLESGRA
jgi:DNA-binding GntR family transcriptional regulator